MKYYIIAGEASGDLHASRLIRSLREVDIEADVRGFGGDLMAAEGATIVRHYRDMAYMGFVPVLLHLPHIAHNMALCRDDIAAWQPHAVILVDYPGFNLSIAKYVHRKLQIPVFYYISPKIWAWKEWRIKAIKRDVDHMLSILPFEKDFYEGKHSYPIHYVGNPTADEVNAFRRNYRETRAAFCRRHGIADAPIIALLAGSRRQEIKDNLPAMIAAASRFDGYTPAVAGAPSIEKAYYERFLNGTKAALVDNDTYSLLAHADAALVTSGTATLETALFDVPQVVCYETPIPRIIAFLRRHILTVKYISLVNLIADKEVVSELVADTFCEDNIATELAAVLPGGVKRTTMLHGYNKVRCRLGNDSAPDNAARTIFQLGAG